MVPVRRARAIERATRRELLRRPGILLATAAVACLLALLHELSAASFGARPGLAVELSLSSAGLFLSLVAGVMGARAAGTGSGLGFGESLGAAPLSSSEYTLGRFAGITTSSFLLLLCLAAGAGAGLLLSGTEGLPAFGVLVVAAIGVVAQAGLFAAIGMAFGALLRPHLAVVAILATLIAARTFAPSLSQADGLLAVVALTLPDPARLDLARDVGSARSLHPGSVALAWAGAAAFAAAFLTVATTTVARRS